MHSLLTRARNPPKSRTDLPMDVFILLYIVHCMIDNNILNCTLIVFLVDYITAIYLWTPFQIYYTVE